MEEFQESDVIWPDQPHQNNYRAMPVASQRRKKTKKKMTHSLPVNIPTTNAGHSFFNHPDSDDLEDEKEMVPPHVMVARRIPGKMAFSVCTGNGRTLKGRDLSQVRNSILRMTGFLETC